jgi:hypothetical protein
VLNERFTYLFIRAIRHPSRNKERKEDELMKEKAWLLVIMCILMLTIASVPDALCTYPPAGKDIMSNTTATIDLEIIGLFNETVTVNGATEVRRSGPYDPGDGHIKIDTEIIFMYLVGFSTHIGSMTIVESPSKTSNGTIRQVTAGTDYPADSFFDVFVEIHTAFPSPNKILHNDDRKIMTARINGIPPIGATYNSTNPVPLKNEQNVIIGFIKNTTHTIKSSVGGIVIPMDKLSLLAPYIGLASTIVVAAVATVLYGKRLRRNKEKQ